MPILSAIVAAIVSALILFIAPVAAPAQPTPEFLGADATMTLAGTVYNLAGSGVSAAATSITLTSLTIPQTGYEIQDSDLSSTFYITLEPGSRTRQEITSCTTVTQNANNTATLSGCARGLLPFSPYTASSTYQFAHGGGTAVVFSNAPQLYEEFAALGNAETITGQWTFASSSLPKASSDTTTSTIAASGFNFATVDYVGDVAVTGCANGSTSVRGCVELATAAEIASSTATGGTGAALVPANSLFSATHSSTTIGVVTNTNGQIWQNFLDLSIPWVFTGGLRSASTTLSGTATVGSSVFLNNVASSSVVISGGSGNTISGVSASSTGTLLQSNGTNWTASFLNPTVGNSGSVTLAGSSTTLVLSVTGHRPGATIVANCGAQNATNNATVTFTLVSSGNAVGGGNPACTLGSGTGGPGGCALNTIVTTTVATTTTFSIANSSANNGTGHCAAHTIN